MIDYAKYEVIKTKKIINSNTDIGYRTSFKTQEDEVNNVIEYLVKKALKLLKLHMIMWV